MNAANETPYRGHGLPPSPTAYAAEVSPTHDEDIAKIFAFIWVTALVRFVFVLRRGEVFTADPIFAALLTFGIPGVLLIMALVTAFKHVREVVRSQLVPARVCER